MLRLSRRFSSSAAKKIEEADLLRSHEFKHLRFTHNLLKMLRGNANQKKDLDLLYMKRNLHFLNKRFSEETFKEMLAVQAKLGYTTPANHGVFHRMFEVAVTNSAAFTKYTYPLQMLLMVESKRIPVEKQQLDSMAERLVDLTDCRGNRETLRTFGAVFELIANGFPKLLPRLFAKSLKTLRECLPGMSIESLVPISSGTADIEVSGQRHAGGVEGVPKNG
jgi:hypothetical protein